MVVYLKYNVDDGSKSMIQLQWMFLADFVECEER